ncbi:MAG: methylaspartate mutase accessory protein GlmL [Christensenellales bacterium]|jgi:uncharacterized protein (TIGR01319 family)
MRPVLLIDFGSTYTKLTAVDLDEGRVVAHTQTHTTADTDVSIGLSLGLEALEEKAGPLSYEARLACSSAAGGLNMVASGLVPNLTAKAAKLAAFGAGAKVIKNYSYQLTREDAEEIAAINPDIMLLTGGTDGGNSEVILHNAKRVAEIPGTFPVVIAGNRSVQEDCVQAFEGSPHPVFRADNVMPEMNRLVTEPVQRVIRQVFLERIVIAKGLSKTRSLLDGILMPTPSAVLEGLSLLSKGSRKRAGIGDLVAVDLGGATTDIYSIADGFPAEPNTVIRGLMEPRVKRTVEGDIGMRFGAGGVLEATGAEAFARITGLPEEVIEQTVARFAANPSALPQNETEEKVDFALAALAIRTALRRHAGSLEMVYTPVGPMYQQTGKDLSGVKRLIVTGGALIYAKRLNEMIDIALTCDDPLVLTPREAAISCDREYILSAMGILAKYDEDTALKLLLEAFGKEEEHAAG